MVSEPALGLTIAAAGEADSMQRVASQFEGKRILFLYGEE